MMNEVMTIHEIESQFESEWVLVEEPETDTRLGVRKGRVVWHSKNRDEVYRKAIEIRPKRFAMLYTGKPEKDSAIIL